MTLPKALKRIPAVFYKSGTGKEPVREWLLEFSKEDRVTIGADIQTVEYGWPIGIPVCRGLGNELYEVRSGISDNRIARVVFFVDNNRMVLLHGFIKKSQKTPPNVLRLATTRKRNVKNG